MMLENVKTGKVSLCLGECTLGLLQLCISTAPTDNFSLISCFLAGQMTQSLCFR